MNRLIPRAGTVATVLLLAAGCVESAPTVVEELSSPGSAEAPASQLELEIAVDPELTEAVIESAEAQLAWAWGGQWSRILFRARMEFQHARAALQAGDTVRTREHARLGRMAVAEALIAGQGHGAIDDLRSGIEDLLMRIEESPQEFHDATRLRATVQSMLQEARGLRAVGRHGAAGARLILAEQHVERARWARTQNAGHDRPRLARLQVARAQEALDLARALLPDEINERQEHLLNAASRLAGAAAEALALGQTRRAIHLAGHAELLALRSVLLPDGASEEEARALAQVSERLLAAATEAVAADPTPAREWLLSLANRLHEAGLAKLEQGETRWAAALLWHSGVTSAVLAP